MLRSTRDAVKAICGADPSVTTAQVQAALAELDGEGVRQVLDGPPIERAYNRAQIAALLGVSVKTVGSYVRRGLLTKILPGANGERATGYTGESVRKLLEGRRSA